MRKLIILLFICFAAGGKAQETITYTHASALQAGIPSEWFEEKNRVEFTNLTVTITFPNQSSITFHKLDTEKWGVTDDGLEYTAAPYETSTGTRVMIQKFMTIYRLIFIYDRYNNLELIKIQE